VTSHLGQALAVMAVLMMPAVASAQAVDARWSGLERARESVVYVQDDSGVETAGRLLRVNPDLLVLQVAGSERQFEMNRVRRVQERDSKRNGALIGAVFGATYGLIAVGIADCPGDDPSGPCPGVRATLYAFSVGTWAAIGTGIDALIRGRDTLYEAPAIGWLTPASRRVPGLPPSRASVTLSFGR
jgi:hypothetical protein